MNRRTDSNNNKHDKIGSGNIPFNIISGSHADKVRKELGEKEVITRTPEQLASRIINIREAMSDCLHHYQHFSGYLCDFNQPDLPGQVMGESCEGLTELFDDFQMFVTTVDTLRDEHSNCMDALKALGKDAKGK
jgi:hypothetical protein